MDHHHELDLTKKDYHSNRPNHSKPKRVQWGAMENCIIHEYSPNVSDASSASDDVPGEISPDVSFEDVSDISDLSGMPDKSSWTLHVDPDVFFQVSSENVQLVCEKRGSLNLACPGDQLELSTSFGTLGTSTDLEDIKKVYNITDIGIARNYEELLRDSDAFGPMVIPEHIPENVELLVIRLRDI